MGLNFAHHSICLTEALQFAPSRCYWASE